VSGWDDLRMPTIAGYRRRGYTPEAIRRFCERIGVAKNDSLVDVALLEHAVRDHLNEVAPRVMGVLNPLKVTITNMADDELHWFDAPLHPTDEGYGTRRLPLTNRLLIERDDFAMQAPRKWRRLTPGSEVRLRYGCLITCDEVITDDTGQVVELRCSWDPASLGGNAPDGRKVRSTLHWVSAAHAVTGEARLYDRLFSAPNPMDVAEGGSFTESLNPDSLTVVQARLEPHVASFEPGTRLQLERLGYFCTDAKDHTAERPVLNRTVTLRDTWARIAARQ
jgi:glutaminyl-tRNA synthetase